MSDINLQPRDSARWRTPPQSRALVTFGSGSGGPGAVKFRVPVPDSRLRVKVSLVFVPVQGNNPLTGLALSASIWLYEVELDAMGGGAYIPCVNILGTQAAPLLIPTANPLQGYSQEFITAADALEGEFIATSGGPIVGTWVLQTRYQPDSVRFTKQEWDELAADCTPRVLGPALVFP
jgi:hypothetical protein